MLQNCVDLLPARGLLFIFHHEQRQAEAGRKLKQDELTVEDLEQVAGGSGSAVGRRPKTSDKVWNSMQAFVKG